MSLFITTPNIRQALTGAELKDYLSKRDEAIIEAFKIHGSPTATAKAMGNGMTRWVVIRVASRAGLWTPHAKELHRQKRFAHVDYDNSIYNDQSKQFKNEEDFQRHIAILLRQKGYAFEAEAKLTEGNKARIDFLSNLFIIEAKNTLKHDELCRGLGQCVTYRHKFKNRKICLVHPDDIEPKDLMREVFAANGFDLIPYRKLCEWLP